MDVFDEVREEVERARQTHAPMASAHEGYAVILEELDELKAEVWKRREKRDEAAMRKEAMQTAAMALRFVLDVCDELAKREPSTEPTEECPHRWDWVSMGHNPQIRQCSICGKREPHQPEAGVGMSDEKIGRYLCDLVRQPVTIDFFLSEARRLLAPVLTEEVVERAAEAYWNARNFPMKWKDILEFSTHEELGRQVRNEVSTSIRTALLEVGFTPERNR